MNFVVSRFETIHSVESIQQVHTNNCEEEELTHMNIPPTIKSLRNSSDGFLVLASLICLGAAMGFPNSAFCQQVEEQSLPEGFVPLFNGKDLTGWEGNPEFFRIEDGAIVAGRLDDSIPHNEFLCTTREYGDFELRLPVKGSEENINGGIQIRSQRVPDDTEVAGYQVDTGTNSTEYMRGNPDFIGEVLMSDAGISD